MKITPEIAQKIWDILVKYAGAKDAKDSQEGFCHYVCSDESFIEYRFVGSFGFGGKFKNVNNHWYISYYSEDYTPEREMIKQKVNNLLYELMIDNSIEKMKKNS